MIDPSEVPTPTATLRAREIAYAACVIVECEGLAASVRAQSEALFDAEGASTPRHVIHQSKAYRAFLKRHRETVADVIDGWHHAAVAEGAAWTDVWQTIADAVRHGKWSHGVRALVEEGRLTPALVREYGLCEEDISSLPGRMDYGMACREPVELCQWESARQAFIDTEVRQLWEAEAALDEERDEWAEMYPPAAWGPIGPGTAPAPPTRFDLSLLEGLTRDGV